jgi:hypothetical protein
MICIIYGCKDDTSYIKYQYAAYDLKHKFLYNHSTLTLMSKCNYTEAVFQKDSIKYKFNIDMQDSIIKINSVATMEIEYNPQGLTAAHIKTEKLFPFIVDDAKGIDVREYKIYNKLYKVYKFMANNYNYDVAPYLVYYTKRYGMFLYFDSYNNYIRINKIINSTTEDNLILQQLINHVTSDSSFFYHPVKSKYKFKVSDIK